MPKKKVPHKGKPKQATEDSDDVVFKLNVSDNEEEYTTVVEFEENKKYSKRLVENNWSKYESAAIVDLDCEEGENEFPKTDDFNYLLKTASSDCSHFQFNSEKQWQSENNPVPSSKIFNLDLNILSSGLACVPFYKRMGLDEKDLSVEDKERFDKEANGSLKEYNLTREKLVKKPETESKAKNVENNSKNVEESFKEQLDLNENNQKNEKKDLNLGSETETEKTIQEVDIFDNKDNKDEVPKDKKKIFFSENENLEDWLDSVLDD